MLNVTIYLDGGQQVSIRKNRDLTPQEFGKQLVDVVAKAVTEGRDVVIPDDVTETFHQFKAPQITGVSVAHMTHKDAADAY